MNSWTKCSDQLPEKDLDCWVCDREKDVFRAKYCGILKRRRWTPIEYVEEMVPHFSYNHEEDFFMYVDEILYWQPYFQPAPPDFVYEDPYKDWIKVADRLPDRNQSCEIIDRGLKLRARHGINGAFQAFYMAPSGKEIVYRTDVATHWRPL